MSVGYDASRIGVLVEMEPTRLEVLLQKPPAEWDSQDWDFAVMRADDGGLAKQHILDVLQAAYPEAKAYSVFAFLDYAIPPGKES